MPGVDKVIFINRTALIAKYGAAGASAVDAAVSRLIAADLTRTITSIILAIDDPADMATVGGVPVQGAKDERGAMAAVDAAFASLAPGYGLLLDGPDVVPHVALSPIAGLSDLDLTIESDLPYASPGGWSRQAANFTAVTRVIGRLPATVGATSADNLVALLDAATRHAPSLLQDFQTPFVISAEVWLASTQLSIATTYGAGITTLSAPTASHPAIDPQLGRKVHFINCHGAVADANFYGQQNLVYPVAMSSVPLRPLVAPGTVVMAECCYGAELYDSGLLGIAEPICMAYLLGGACAFLGSTCIAYGQATGNGQADLLTQYFLQSLLTGKSSGRAFLEARQQFVRTQVMSNPANLKTLAQFVLFGDPSCHPCRIDAAANVAATAEIGAKAMAVRDMADEVIDQATQRLSLRGAQHSAGVAAAAASSRPGRPVVPTSELGTRIRTLADQRGLQIDALNVLATSIGAHMRAATRSQTGKAGPLERRVGIVVDKSKSTPGHPLIKLLVAYLIDDKVSRVEMIESR